MDTQINIVNDIDISTRESIPGIQKQSKTIVLMSFLARIACHYRMKIKFSDSKKYKPCYPNFYGLVLSGSGSGKDTIYNAISELPSFQEYEEEESNDLGSGYRRRKSVYAEYLQKNCDMTEKQAKKAAEEKVLEGTAVVKKATMAAFERKGYEVSKYDFGQTTVLMREMALWIDSVDKKEANSVFDFLSQVYQSGTTERGDTVQAGLKNKELKIKELPMNCLMMSSASKVETEKNVRDVFQSFLETAGARRFTMFIDNREKIEFKAVDLLHENDDVAYEALDKKMKQFINACSPGVNREKKTIVMDNEAREMVRVAQEKVFAGIEKDKLQDGRVRTAAMSVPWQAIRISALIALWDHPTNPIITKEDYRQAFDFCKECYMSFKFFDMKVNKPETIALYDFIKSKNGVFLGEICEYGKDKGFCAKNNNNKSVWGRSALQFVEEYAEQFNEILRMEQVKKGEKYLIEKLATKVEATDIPVQISTSMTKAYGYKVIENAMYSDIGGIIQKPRVENYAEDSMKYSAGVYKDGHRIGSNWQGGNNLLIVDFDNAKGEEMKIEQAKDLFSGLRYIIQPTRSHQIEKEKEGKKDRYRVIFPTVDFVDWTEETHPKRYDRVCTNFLEAFGIEKFADTVATSNSVGMWFPSPHPSEYINGDMLSWKSFDFEKPKPTKKPYIPDPTKPYTGVKKNVDPSLAGMFAQHQGVSGGDKVLVRCTKHGEDKHESAFIRRHPNGKLYMCCSGCKSKGMQSTWFES